ncbi:MAG: protease self-immunity [Bacteriovoracaceae bacterium]|nr:protease self-immunity [Bacteriovoracaceae bacterium]
MKKERALEIKSLFLVYGTLILFACLGDWFSHHQTLWVWKESHLEHPSFIFVGFAFVFFYVAGAMLASRMFSWATELEKIFAQVMTPLSYFQIFYLSILSGFTEEWFFRGILLNHFGIIISSMIFSVAHFLPSRSLWAWPLISFFAGTFFGALYFYSESLLLVAIVHTSINIILLFRLNQATVQSPSLT